MQQDELIRKWHVMEVYFTEVRAHFGHCAPGWGEYDQDRMPNDSEKLAVIEQEVSDQCGYSREKLRKWLRYALATKGRQKPYVVKGAKETEDFLLAKVIALRVNLISMDSLPNCIITTYANTVQLSSKQQQHG